MLHAKLFGPGEVTYKQTPLDGFPNRKAYALLAYLLLNRQYPIQREQLAAVFWADYPTQKSRKYLRHALWHLRQLLSDAGASPDEYLLAGDESIAFVRAGDYWLDVEEFAQTISQYEAVPAHALDSEQAHDLEEAITLYTGELLEGIYEDWCLYDRERCKLLYVNALKKLVTYHEDAGTYDRGLVFGGRMLAYDKTLERVHQQMMRLYWLAGDRNAALAQYKRCVQILREELDVPPMKETTHLYTQMLHNKFSSDREQQTATAESTSQREVSADRQGDHIQPVAEYTLRQVRQLQATLEETSAELRRLERVLSSVLSAPRS